jgi:hypothetical protein
MSTNTLVCERRRTSFRKKNKCLLKMLLLSKLRDLWVGTRFVKNGRANKTVLHFRKYDPNI